MNAIRVIGLLFALIAYVTMTMLLDISIENSAREQARANLKQIKYCVNTELKGVAEPDDDQLTKAIDKCGRFSKLSATGDIFAFKRQDNMFVFDASSDCRVEGGKYFDKELCQLFNKPETCESAKLSMLSGVDSSDKFNETWQFRDDSEEWIEWIYIPAVSNGFNGKAFIGDKLPNQVIIGQGIVVKEYYDNFYYMIMFFKIASFLGILHLSVFAIIKARIHNGKYDRRRTDTKDK